jgi:hypothetical protein
MSTKRLLSHRRRSLQPASAKRDASYERSSYGLVLPEQFFDSRIKLAAVCPETALMYAVLEEAFLCVRKQFETERFVPNAREAEDWFFSDDSRWLFSFVCVCDALGLDRQYIRKKLKHWTPSHPDTAPPTRD